MPLKFYFVVPEPLYNECYQVQVEVTKGKIQVTQYVAYYEIPNF